MSATRNGAAGKMNSPGPETRIATVTLNPMLDKTVTVPSLRRGSIHRAQGIGMVVGGKGVNVSRQLLHLGQLPQREVLHPGNLSGLWQQMWSKGVQ